MSSTCKQSHPSDIVSLLIPSAIPSGASPGPNDSARHYLLIRHDVRGLWLPFRTLVPVAPVADQRPVPSLAQQLDTILVDVRMCLGFYFSRLSHPNSRTLSFRIICCLSIALHIFTIYLYYDSKFTKTL